MHACNEWRYSLASISLQFLDTMQSTETGSAASRLKQDMYALYVNVACVCVLRVCVCEYVCECHVTCHDSACRVGRRWTQSVFLVVGGLSCLLWTVLFKTGTYTSMLSPVLATTCSGPWIERISKGYCLILLRDHCISNNLQIPDWIKVVVRGSLLM